MPGLHADGTVGVEASGVGVGVGVDASRIGVIGGGMVGGGVVGGGGVDASGRGVVGGGVVDASGRGVVGGGEVDASCRGVLDVEASRIGTAGPAASGLVCPASGTGRAPASLAGRGALPPARTTPASR